MSVFVPHRENITPANTTSSVNGSKSTGPSKIIFPEEKTARPVVYYVFLMASICLTKRCGIMTSIFFAVYIATGTS